MRYKDSKAHLICSFFSFYKYFLNACQLPGMGLVVEFMRTKVAFESSFDPVPSTEGAFPTSISDLPCKLVVLS